LVSCSRSRSRSCVGLVGCTVTLLAFLAAAAPGFLHLYTLAPNGGDLGFGIGVGVGFGFQFPLPFVWVALDGLKLLGCLPAPVVVRVRAGVKGSEWFSALFPLASSCVHPFSSAFSLRVVRFSDAAPMG